MAKKKPILNPKRPTAKQPVISEEEKSFINGEELMVRIPPQTRPNAKLRLKSQGIQKSRQTGHLYVKINAVLPDNITDDIIQTLKQKLGR